jgi:subtilase family serine protease
VEELETRNLLSSTIPLATPAAHGAPPPAPPSPAIYNPIQLATAYFGSSVSATAGAGMTIAIVDAYNDPTITTDLSTFNAHVNDAYVDSGVGTWGGGQAVPAIKSGQFTIVNQNGGTIAHQTSTRGTTPAYNASWDVEIALDVEWAHAMAPGANIMLVEANSNSYADLMTAVKYAATPVSLGGGGAQVVSMSWGSNEFSGQTGAAYDGVFAAFAGTGVTFVASSGDSGVASWPAVSPDVVGVGGTVINLNYATGAYSSETGWSGSGGGVSKYETIPSYQSGIGGSNGASTTMRNSPDIAYDSGSSNSYVWFFNGGSWNGVYGTSAGAPQWAAFIATSDSVLSTPLDSTQALPGLYQLPNSDLHDIAAGANHAGSAGVGYDLVTGLGSPATSSMITDLATIASAIPASTTPFVAPGGGAPGHGKPSEVSASVLATTGSPILAGQLHSAGSWSTGSGLAASSAWLPAFSTGAAHGNTGLYSGAAGQVLPATSAADVTNAGSDASVDSWAAFGTGEVENWLNVDAAMEI